MTETSAAMAYIAGILMAVAVAGYLGTAWCHQPVAMVCFALSYVAAGAAIVILRGGAGLKDGG